MSDYNLSSHNECCVPIKVDRVFDSCSDKDCFCDLQITLDIGELPSNITIVKSRCVTVDTVCISVDTVPFNKGFYSVDLTFSFTLEILGYERACTAPVVYTGTAFASKHCILYGGESTAKTFYSDDTPTVGNTDECCNTVNLPTAVVSVLEPIVLETRIGIACVPTDPAAEVPCVNQRSVFVTLGLFSVTELIRPVTLMVPACDSAFPKKECCYTEAESPCEAFGRIKFPAEQFSPATLIDSDCNTSYDCCENSD